MILEKERALLKLISFVQNMKFLHKCQPYLDTILMFFNISEGKLSKKCYKDKYDPLPYGSEREPL